MAARRLPPRRRGALLTLFVLAILATTAPARGTTPPPQWAAWDLAPGVAHLLTERPGLVARAAVVSAGAPVALRPVLAHDVVGGAGGRDEGRETVSSMCGRAGGIVCVNGDFFNCKWCGQPAGGVVDRARPLRSFRPDHEQVSIVGGRPTFEMPQWVGHVRGRIGHDRFTLDLASLNRGPMPGRAVMYSPDWGPTTPQVDGQVEVVFASGGGYAAGVRDLVPVAIRPTSGVIPRDGVVIAANGRAAQKLNWLWHAWHARRSNRRVRLETALSDPAELSIGGHPILLRDGVRQSLDPNDSMVTRRHPRTILAWTDAGDLLLVAIDGRWPGRSDGATLAEATDLVAELGATNAINLDGGGSTTFALRCGTGACAANHPSDGRERPVALTLAVVPATPVDDVLRAAAATAPVVEPAPVAVATTVPAPIAAPPTTVAASAPARSTGLDEVAAAVPMPPARAEERVVVPARSAPSRDRLVPVTVAVAAIAAFVTLATRRRRTTAASG